MDCFAHGSKSSNFIKGGVFLDNLGAVTAQQIFVSMQLISYIISFLLLVGWFFGCLVVWLVSWLVGLLVSQSIGWLIG
jgi:hypothetical protein